MMMEIVYNVNHVIIPVKNVIIIHNVLIVQLIIIESLILQINIVHVYKNIMIQVIILYKLGNT